MPNNPKVERVLARMEPGRREAMRKILVGAAYTAPVVASFSMTSLDAVAQTRCANQVCDVPTTSQWTLAAMAGALGAFGAWILRRRSQR